MSIQRNFIRLFFLSISLFVLNISFCFAAESPTCDLGDIKNVSIFIEDTWHVRPDSRIDDLPHTSFLGPFPVRAYLESWSSIVKVWLYYSDDGDTYGSVPMVIDEDNYLHGEIPFHELIEENTRFHFYLSGYDSNGHIVWTDEIPYTCPPEDYTHGDPYNFLVLAKTPTIIIDDCDTGVTDQVLDNGYTMSDLIAECARDINNHGEFISCVTHLTNDWKINKRISGEEKGAIQKCAAKASIP